jgi:YfiH family protein
MTPIWKSGEFPGSRRAAWFITGRHGGFSSPPWDSLNLGSLVGDEPETVARNREFVRSLVGASELAWAALEHGATVARVRPGDEPHIADALLTEVPGLGLAVTAADCVPIGFSAPGMVAVAHSGWRGLLTGVIPATIRAMVDAGAQGITAVVGPGICAGCYPVDRDRRDELAAALDPEVVAAACSPPEVEKAWIDVAAGVSAELRGSRYVGDVIHVSACTKESADLFSFRRDAKTGRHAMIVVMRDE